MIPEHEDKEGRVVIVVVFLIMTLLFITTLAGFAWVVSDVRDLSRENQHRIEDIQRSRLESCRQTYAGIREVFRPFFPTEPLTKQQQKDLDKFNNQITKLQLQCVKQVKPKGV
jgi:hypothetical protein